MPTSASAELEASPTIADTVPRQARNDLLRELSRMADHPAAMFASRYLLTLLPVTIAGVVLAVWRHPVAFVLFAVVAGFTQNALGVLMHEGSHYFFHRRRERNDLLANVLVCLPICNTVQGYRRDHFEHHRHSGEAGDPYHGLYSDYRSRGDVLKGLAADLTGLSAARSFVQRYAGPPRPGRDESRWWAAALLAEQAAIAVLLWWATGWMLAWAFLWILPLATIPIAINRARTLAEHYPGFEALPANRTTLVGIVEYLCVAPYGYSHHFEHHFAPTVPYYRLAWAHGYLKDRGLRLRSHEYNSAGYLRTFARMMRELGAADRPR